MDPVSNSQGTTAKAAMTEINRAKQAQQLSCTKQGLGLRFIRFRARLCRV